MNQDIGQLIQIECGRCGRSAPVDAWCRTQTMELPRGEFQCPHCQAAWRREPIPNRRPWDKFVRVVPIASHL